MIYVIGYLVCAAVIFRILCPRMVAQLFARKESRYEDLNRRYAEIDRGPVVFGAALISLFFPIVLPIYLLIRAVMSSDIVKASIELNERDRAELDRLRKLAAEYNLPMGDERL